MKSIALVIPYFGRFRNDFGFWMESVRHNPTIDFLLFTDLQVNNPACNLKVIPCTFSQMQHRAQSVFDFSISLSSVYKLCDYKPAYGEIFAEELKGYDFWGHCDNDLIFGDIRSFITDDILEHYDKVLSRGHFTLYRNTLEVNTLYRNEPSYKKVFTSPDNFCFDEWPGVSNFWRKEHSERFYDKMVYDDIDYNKFHFITVHKKAEDKHRSNFVYSYEDGKLYRVFLEQKFVKRQEIMYVHFQKRNLQIFTPPHNILQLFPTVLYPTLKLSHQLSFAA